MTRTLTTSPDGQLVVARADRQVLLMPGSGGDAIGRVHLDSDDADIALVNGPPNVVIIATRVDGAAHVASHLPPELEATARVDVPNNARIACVSGGRLVLVSADNKELTIVRASGRGLASHLVDLQNGVLEFVAGIERNQLVVGQTRKLEVWDAVSGRPLRKLALDLPPPPRTIGSAAGHLVVTRPGSDEVFVYRLSDGRPFRHYIGAPVEHVISHAGSPLVVLVTQRGLVRLHCYAHSLFTIDSPWRAGTALAQLVIGEDITLLGMAEGDAEPWRVPIGGVGNAVPVEAETAAAPLLVTAADKLRAMRETASATVATNQSAPVAPAPVAITRSRGEWRDALATYGLELARGVESELPTVGVETELGELAQRVGLSAQARRALIALYSLYLVGEPGLSIARLAKLLGEWTEPLGQGQLAQLAMIDRDGVVRLAKPVSDLVDGAAPRAIRIVGGGAATPHVGVYRFNREGKTDIEIEAELATRFGRIAVVEGDLATAILEARLHGATAVSFATPTERPRPWPHGAGLVLVLHGTTSSWIADVPALGTVSTSTT